MQPNVIHTRRALAYSLLVHGAAVVCVLLVGDERPRTEIVDIELAPPPPEVEALPAEVAQRRQQEEAAKPDEPSPAAAPTQGDIAIDAGAPDAPPDAAPKKKKKRRPDAAPIEASIDELIAETDAGGGDALVIATGGDGAAEEGTGDGAGGDALVAGRADEASDAAGIAGATNEPAVDGAPTTAGTAANLIAYFPAGHVVTALIRFDRLRGTEWEAQTERLLRPMPDYRNLFGTGDAQIAQKLDTLVISTPSPQDAAATTLVARTKLARADLRAFLGATSPVTWSAARGGLLGKRTGKLPPNDKRVFLSPFTEWFLLALPQDLGALTSPAPGALDAAVAKGKLPPWLAGIRGIEAESGDPRGPALVLTLALGGQTYQLGGNDFGLGIKSVTAPDRISLAMELVKQGWLVRGNMRFTSDAAAADFITAADSAKQRIADSRALQLAMGKPVARVIANLRFARTGPRVSYTTSISIADARMILAVAAQQLDAYFTAAASPPPP